MGLARRRAQVTTLSWRYGVGDAWREAQLGYSAEGRSRTYWSFCRLDALLEPTVYDTLWYGDGETSMFIPDVYTYDEDHMQDRCSDVTTWDLSTLYNMVGRRMLRVGQSLPIPDRPWGMV